MILQLLHVNQCITKYAIQLSPFKAVGSDANKAQEHASKTQARTYVSLFVVVSVRSIDAID